jgi:hypothetical protein
LEDWIVKVLKCEKCGLKFDAEVGAHECPAKAVVVPKVEEKSSGIVKKKP